jgi:Helix-turn-helix
LAIDRLPYGKESGNIYFMGKTPSGISLPGLRAELERRDITPAEFARLSGLDPGHVHRLMTGERRAGYSTMEKIEGVLGRGVEKILGKNCQVA